jgi:hypothetical protein
LFEQRTEHAVEDVVERPLAMCAYRHERFHVLLWQMPMQGFAVQDSSSRRLRSRIGACSDRRRSRNPPTSQERRTCDGIRSGSTPSARPVPPSEA